MWRNEFPSRFSSTINEIKKVCNRFVNKITKIVIVKSTIRKIFTTHIFFISFRGEN